MKIMSSIGKMAGAWIEHATQGFSVPRSTTELPGLVLSIIVLYSSNVYAVEIDLSAISHIESSNNSAAIGDGGQALGLYQLHKCVIQDYNEAHDTSYLHQDALSSTISHKVVSWYVQDRIPALLKHFKIPVNTENVLTAYNLGIGEVVKGRVAKGYIAKYRRAL